jgi:hypothetical protein
MSTTNNTSATATEDKAKLQSVMKDLEKQGEADVKKLQKAYNNIIPPEQTLMDLLQKGGDEFERQMGRKMTYGEMRDMYG